MSVWNAVRISISLAFFTATSVGWGQMDAARARRLPPASRNLATGPEPGQRVPAFQLPDQKGTRRDFASLRGRNGLLLAFVRSADW